MQAKHTNMQRIKYLRITIQEVSHETSLYSTTSGRYSGRMFSYEVFVLQMKGFHGNFVYLEVGRFPDREGREGLHETTLIMNTDRKWVVVRIDGKIAAISTDYRMLADISARLAAPAVQSWTKGRKGGSRTSYREEITATTVSFEEVWKLRQEIRWDDLMLFGTDFQKRVWRKLWELTHHEYGEDMATAETEKKHLICYTDFAELCSNKAGVRAVAHAIGLNPVSVIIPCHLVIPKETIDRIAEIQKKAEETIFKGDDLCITSILSDPATNFGEYALGRDLKRELILKEFE